MNCLTLPLEKTVNGKEPVNWLKLISTLIPLAAFVIISFNTSQPPDSILLSNFKKVKLVANWKLGSKPDRKFSDTSKYCKCDRLETARGMVLVKQLDEGLKRGNFVTKSAINYLTCVLIIAEQ